MTTVNPTAHEPQGRALAALGGCVFLAGTCVILFEDVLMKGAPFALKHVLTAVILAGTIMTAHLADSARRARRWPALTGFVLVCFAGTLLVVYTSTGRQSVDTIQTAAQIDETNQRRADVLSARARNVRRLDDANDDVRAACKGGVGKGCKGAKATVDVYVAAIKGHDADLAALGPTRVTAPEAESFAEVVSVIFDVDKARVKAAAVLVVPFIVTLFLEFGMIVAWGYAARPAHANRASATAELNAELSAEKLAALRERFLASDAATTPVNVVALFPNGSANCSPNGEPGGEPGGAPNGSGPKPGRRATGRKADVLADIKARDANGERFASQEDLRAALAERFGPLAKSTLSEWLGELEAERLIADRTVDGRRKRFG